MDFNHARPTEHSQPRRGGRRDDGVRDRDRKRAKLSISVEAFDHVSAVATFAAVGAIADLSIDAAVADLPVVAADAALIAADHDQYLAFDIVSRRRPSPSTPPYSSQPSHEPSAIRRSSRPRRRQSNQPQQTGASLAQNSARCANSDKSVQPDASIGGCNAVIQETAKNLAAAYFFRGAAHVAKNDFDRAIADYTQAIAIDPTEVRLPQQPRRDLRTEERHDARDGRL